MTPHRDVTAAGERAGLQGRHVLYMLLGFFAVVFAVNGVFLASAIKTYSGVVSAEPYAKGLHYNERIVAGERQSKLRWHETLSVASEGAVSIAVVDDAGRPVRGLKFSGSIGRPSTNRLDRALVLAETEPGRYVVQAGPLDQGNWLLTLAAVSRDYGDEPIYRLKRRVCLKC